MKFTAIFLIAAALQVSAKGYSQITLSEKNAPLQKVFKELQRQSGYDFLYPQTIIEKAGKVDLELRNVSLQQALEECLKGKGLTYSILEKTVIIKKVESPNEPTTEKENLPPPPVDITGKITDEDGNPLMGATVSVKGTNIATKTNANGMFILRGVEENVTLEISFVGFIPQSFVVGNRENVFLQLKRSDNPLDVVQVQAYGTTSKRLATGNISTVKAVDIEKQPVNNPLLALQGRVPGLVVTQANGLPGSGVTVRIQGQNSIQSGSDPLYVIDGVPYTSQLLPALSNVLGTSGPPVGGMPAGNGNPFSFINPSDIESIDVLKDADATSIYGSRGANGVILITTKKGKTGRTEVSLNLQRGWGKVTNKLDLLNTKQYLEMRHEGKQNDNAAVLATDYDINGTWDTTRYTDWQKELIGGTAEYTDIEGSVSGGNANTQFLIGTGYHRESTVFPGNLYDQKGSVHFNINNISTNQKFQLQFSGNYLIDNNKIQSQDLTNIALQLAPNAPAIYNEDGTLNWAPVPRGGSTISSWRNPLAYLYNRYNNKTSNLIGSLTLRYRISKNFEVKSNFGYTDMSSKETLLGPLLAEAPENRPTSSRYASYGHNRINSWIIEPQIAYTGAISRGKLDILLGATFQENTRIGEQVGGFGYNSDQILEDSKSATMLIALSSISSLYRYNAFFGRVNYNWLNKFILNFTARRDGSSRFGSSNLFHNFGSIGGAWVFHKERFFEKKLPFISFGKLRGSFGTTGNDQIGDYQFMNLYQPYYVPIPYRGESGMEPVGLPNPNLQWEETKKIQFGLDLGLFADRLVFNANYYRNQSSNQLLPYVLPLTTGFANTPSINFPAVVRNSGWELSMTATVFKAKEFSWTSSINLTIPKNKLVDFPDLSSSSYASALVIGSPITLRPVYHFLGVDPASGLYTFATKNGSVTSRPSVSDKTVFINTSPEYYGGFQNNFRYKGFELDFLFQFVKQKGQDYSFGSFYPGQRNLNQPTSIIDRWQKPGDIKPIQRYASGAVSNNSRPNTYMRESDISWGDASFIRLKNLSLSWQMPELWKKKISLKNFRLFVQGQNLATITNYQGLDPENTSVFSLPPLRVATIGVQLGL